MILKLKVTIYKFFKMKYLNTNMVYFQMPTVTEEQVKIYMDLYGQDLKENNKAMFLRSIRLASQKENVYICGRVSAEMYKNASIMWTSSRIVSVLYNNASVNVLQAWNPKHTVSMSVWSSKFSFKVWRCKKVNNFLFWPDIQFSPLQRHETNPCNKYVLYITFWYQEMHTQFKVCFICS